MKTHPLNVSYLVVGLVYLGIAGTWALHSARIVDTGQLRWILPLTLVVAGAAGLVAFAAKGLGRQGDEEQYPGTSYDEPVTRTSDEGDDR